MTFHQAKSLLAATVLAGLVYAIGRCIYLLLYRLFFHPLRHFPGPKLAATTYWYEVYYEWFKGPYHGLNDWHIRELHTKYGPIFRRSPDELSIQDSEWFDFFFAGGRRNKWNREGVEANGATQATISRTVHKYRRGALTRFFSKRSVLKLEPLIADKIQLLSKETEAYVSSDKIFNAGVAFGALTLDVITDYCFDNSFGCLEKPDFSPEWKKTFYDMFESIPLLRCWGFIVGRMLFWPRRILRAINPTIEQFVVLQEAVRLKIEEAKDQWQKDQGEGEKNGGTSFDETAVLKKNRTIFYDILDSQLLPPEDKSVQRLTDEAFGIVIAGGDTTGRVLANLMYYLHADQQWLELVQKELATVMPSPNTLAKWSDLEALPIFSSCIKETLRVSSLITERIALYEPEDTLTYGDWIIPPGTAVTMSLCDMHNDAAVYDRPSEFVPDRWLNAKERGQNLDRYFAPFSRGSRGCLGVNLAYAQIYLAAAAMIRRFDFELSDVVWERDVKVVRDCFVGLAPPDSRGIRFKVVGKRP